MPEMYQYLNEGGRYATTASGKVDIAMPFIEQSARKLRAGGRLGFIVQNRFFKSDYGEATRKWLVDGHWLSRVEDFRDLQVFPGRTTYTAILVLQRNSEQVMYRTFSDRAGAEADAASLETTVGLGSLGSGPWSLDEPDLMAVHSELSTRHGTIEDHPDMEISVGLQTLYGKLYQIQPTRVAARTIHGVNGLGADVALERSALRPLCRNRGFYPFRIDNADAWVIFPYSIENDVAREIEWPEFKVRFPKAAAYLEDNRNTLKKAVEVQKGRERWHLYMYPKNLVSQSRPKVLFPSTIEDTVAAVDGNGDVYQDNVRVNSITCRSGAIAPLVIAAVFNSSTFSALARLKAGLSDGGWRQFNRQFASLVPFPFRVLSGGPLPVRLEELAKGITMFQDELRHARGEGERQAVRGTLTALWAELDAVVDQAYQLTEVQSAILRSRPRLVDRVELPLRSAHAQEFGDTLPFE
jgi:hypothetical protein